MKRKILSMLFALVLAVSLMLAVAWANGSSVSGAVTLVAEGDSTAEWTDEEAKVGDHSAKLTMPNRNWYIEPICNAEAQIDVEDVLVGDIAGFTFWQKVDNIDLPLCIEFNLSDGKVIRGDGLDRSKFPGGDAPHTDWFQVDESDISFGYRSWDYYKDKYSGYTVQSVYIGYGPIGSTQSVVAYVDDFVLNGITYVFEPPTMSATVDIDPDTLNLNSKGKWVTCYIELPEGYDVNDIDVGTVMLNETVPAEPKPTEIGDYDDDGIPDLMVKFDRSEVKDILEPGDAVPITVTGALTDGPSFEGTDTIRVIKPAEERVSVDIDTKYWEDGSYDLRITAQAAPYDATSIRISGPHIDTATVEPDGGDPHYLYDDGEHHDGAANDGLWLVLLNIEKRPKVGETITFDITYTDGSSETKQKGIDGVLSKTARLLSPPDGSTVNTLTPTFEWNNPPVSGLTYSVQIDDTNHNRVYDVYDLPDGTTSHEIPADYLNWETTYYWLVSASDVNGNEALTNWDAFTTSGTAASTTRAIAQPKFGLSQNYPNPFNPQTTIEYDVDRDCDVTLKIYNLAGQLIKTLVDEYQTVGHYTITWYGDTDAGQEIASGVYFYRVKAGDKAAIKKMVVLK